MRSNGLVAILLLSMAISSCGILDKLEKGKRTTCNWCDKGLISSKYPENTYYAEYLSVECKRRSLIQQKQEELKYQLMNQLSARIITSINTEGVINSTSLNNDGSKAFFGKNSFQSIQNSSTKLSNVKDLFYLDANNNKLHGLVYVQKNELRLAYISNVKQQIRSAQSLANSIKGLDNPNDMRAYNKSMNDLNSMKRQIDIDLTVLSVLNKNDYNYTTDMDEINILRSTLESDINRLLIKNSSNYVSGLLVDASTLQAARSFAGAIEKYNQILVFSPSNDEALSGRKACVDQLLLEKMVDVKKYVDLDDYESALTELEFVFELAPELYDGLKEQSVDLQKKFFEKSINEIVLLIKYDDKNNIDLAASKLSKLDPYVRFNIAKYQDVKKQVDEKLVEREIAPVREAFQSKDYTLALNRISGLSKNYPFNNDVVDFRTRITEKIYQQKKHEFLMKKPTRLMFEFNFSLANRPVQFINDNRIKLENPDLLLDDLFSFYQFCFYGKFNVKEKGTRKNGHTKFQYSQAGIRFGLMNPSSGINDLQGDTVNAVVPRLSTLTASLVLRRFLMINLGVATTQDSVGFAFKNRTLGLGEIGFRIPFGQVHLTTDVATYTDFDRSYLLFFRGGLSINIGSNRKFTKEDRANISYQISKMSL
jgi:tetratricopeptide (TPR) repeat protein